MHNDNNCLFNNSCFNGFLIYFIAVGLSDVIRNTYRFVRDCKKIVVLLRTFIYVTLKMLVTLRSRQFLELRVKYIPSAVALLQTRDLCGCC